VPQKSGGMAFNLMKDKRGMHDTLENAGPLTGALPLCPCPRHGLGHIPWILGEQDAPIG
jgi:hypothetical protein